MRQILSADELVTAGRFNFGTYARPFVRVNPLDAEIVSGLPLPRSLKGVRLKEWQAFQLGDERFFVNVALFNAKLLALAQLKIYDRREERLLLYERKLPPWTLRAPSGLFDSEMRYRGRDGTIVFRNLLRRQRLEITVDLAPRGGPRVAGTVTALAAEQQPQVVCIPFAENRGMYSHKGLMPGEGELAIDGERLVLRADRGFVLMDDHKGYYPYRMRWDWVTGAGRDEHGALIGFNLTRNQSRDQERFNENCFWRDGRLHLLPPVTFFRHPASADRPEHWEIRDQRDRVSVDFTVETESRVDINALVIRSDYHGPLGSFRGTLRPDDGPKLRVDGLFGMGERFDLRC